MAFRNEKGNYWTSVQDDLYYRWCHEELTPRESLKIYNALYPVLKHMARVILERYFFNYDINDKDTLMTDAIQKVLIKGDISVDRKDRAYSYVGTAMKRYYYDVLVMIPKFKKNIQFDKNYSPDDEFIQPTFAPDYDEFDYAERELLYNKILIEINSWIKYEENKLKRKIKRNAKEIKFNINTIDFLTKFREYFEKYWLHTDSCDIRSAIDYVKFNTDMQQIDFINLCRRFLGTYADTNWYDKRESKVDKKYTKEKSTYFQDDLVPNSGKSYTQRGKRKYAENKIGNYHDYRYF